MCPIRPCLPISSPRGRGRNLVIKSILGKNYTLHSSTTLSGCILLPGCVVEDGCHMQFCVLGANATIKKKCQLMRCSFSPKYVMEAESDHQDAKKFTEFVKDEQ